MDPISVVASVASLISLTLELSRAARSFYYKSSSGNQSLFFPPRRRLSIGEWKMRYLSSTSKETKFLAFLASYGPDGVSLRELIMLGTLRQSGNNSKNHWLKYGEAGPLEEAMHETCPESRDHSLFLDDFMDAVRSSSNLEHFQSRLKDLGLIEVWYKKGTTSNVASQYWYTDERIWKIPVDQYSGARILINNPIVLQGLLDVFMEMPDKDVSPAAERQREIYHYHAGFHIRRMLQCLEVHRLLHPQAVFVILHLLTHRYTHGDASLLNFVLENSIRIPHLRTDVMLLWAELKENAFLRDYNGLCTIRDRLAGLMTSNEDSSCTTQRANGLLGFLLVDLMQSAKEASFEDIVSDAVKLGTEWVDRTSTMTSTLENTALCEARAAFNVHDEKKVIPEKYCLLYGYHLSRAGLLVQGDHSLARGLNRRLFPWWSYEFERISIALRLGRRNQAAQMLDSLQRLALYKRDNGHDPILWKRSGECAELFILLNLYEADCCASANRLDDACAKLEAGINITSSIYDIHIRTLRVTLEKRLLELRVWQRKYKEALPVALDLVREILDRRTGSIFASRTVYEIVQQVLNLSNRLLSAGDAAGSLRLLEAVTDIEACLAGVLSEGLKSYVRQRIGTARRFFASNQPSKPESNTRLLDNCPEDFIRQYRVHPEHDLETLEANENQLKLLGPKPSEPKPSPGQRLARKSKIKVHQIRNMLLRAPRAPITEPGISLATTVSGGEQGSPQTEHEPFTESPELN